jgi:hypothetical protein
VASNRSGAPFLSPVSAQTLPEETIVTKIVSMTQPIPRGTVIGKRVGVQPIDEAEHFSDAKRAAVGSTCAISRRYSHEDR